MANLVLPKTFADLNRKLTVLTTPPVNMRAITVTEANAGTDITCRVTKENTRLSATASDTLEDSAVCEPNGSTVAGKSNYEASLGVFRFFDEASPGQPDPVADELFQLVKLKGSPLYVMERHSNKRWSLDWEEQDEYSVFQLTMDNWQRPSDQHTGYIKVVVPAFVADAELNGSIAPAGA